LSENDQVLVDNAVAERQAARSQPLAEEIAFELFACEQVLRGYDLSEDEIESGRIGGGNDGGLDGVFVFLSETLVTEDAEVVSDDSRPSDFGRGLVLELWLIQAKRSPSFGETAIDLAASSLGRLLDLQLDEGHLREFYSAEVIQAVRLFTTAWQKLATRGPVIRIHFRYVSRGDAAGADSKVRAKCADLCTLLAGTVSGAAVDAELVGAAELWLLHSQVPSYTLQLAFQENATRGTSHVALVKLEDYFDFLKDERGALRRHIFDWNVRDYQGDVEVNKEIRDSLLSDSSPEFWWLNNGVTIICASALIVGKTFNLDDVQIVNGLQTSQTVFEVLSTAAGEAAARDRSILVRILATGDQAVRDQVIRATNRQTNVPLASLRATDDVQRQIESYFASKGWFYDRRKNYYRNIGKQPERILSIPLLAQAVMAIGLAQPDNSRARPSSLLKRDDTYQSVFNAGVPLQTYLWLGTTQRHVDALLASDSAQASTSERTNLRFYVSMLAVARRFGGRVYSPVQLTNIAEANEPLTDDEIVAAFNDLRAWANDYVTETGFALDRAAKNREFVSYVLARAFGDGSSDDPPRTTA